MNEGKENIIVKKSYSFALSIIQLYKQLIEKKEYVLSKQILRSGTSVGANIHEAISGESTKDFIHKLAIAVKEARETFYWLNLLNDSHYITPEDFSKLQNACDELNKILNSIILTTRKKYVTNS